MLQLEPGWKSIAELRRELRLRLLLCKIVKHLGEVSTEGILTAAAVTMPISIRDHSIKHTSDGIPKIILPTNDSSLEHSLQANTVDSPTDSMFKSRMKLSDDATFATSPIAFVRSHWCMANRNRKIISIHPKIYA